MAFPQGPRALLIVPPLYDFAAFDLFSKPLGLMRMGTWLESAGWETRMINALDYRDPLSCCSLGSPRRDNRGCGKFFRQPYGFPVDLPSRLTHRRDPERGGFSRYGICRDSFREQLKALWDEGSFDLVLVSTAMTYWYPGVQEAVAEVRREAACRGEEAPHIVCGGVYASLMREHCSRVCEPDAVMVSAEGTAELRRWANTAGFPLPETEPGRFYRWFPQVPGEAGVLEINRGCPQGCDYCASAQLIPRFEGGGADGALHQLDYLYRKVGTRNFAFYDDALLLRPEEGILPFLDGLKQLPYRRELSFFLPNALHMRALTPNLLREMVSAGFREFRMGFESSSPEFHRLRDGKLGAETAVRTVEIFKEAGVSLSQAAVYVLAGLPGQVPGEVEVTLRVAEGLGFSPYLAQYSPVPGTPLWTESVAQSDLSLADEPLFHNNTLFPLESQAFSAAEMQRLKTLARSIRTRQGLP